MNTEKPLDRTTVETIPLTQDRFLGVAWKNGSVHSLCLATDSAVAQKVAEQSLKLKPSQNQVYENIDKLVKNLFAGF